MGELSTYTITDFIPFTREVYLRLFVRLNESLWPAHVAMLAVTLAALWSAWRGRGRFLGASLGTCWLVVGLAYHLEFYANLNWAGTYFGWMFLLQGGLLAILGGLGHLDRPEETRLDAPGWAGLGLAVVAVVGFPAIAPLAARGWSGAEVVGISPDPTTLATLGATLTPERLPWYLWVVPLAWCFVTGATSWGIGTFSGLVTASLGLGALGLAMWKALR